MEIQIWVWHICHVCVISVGCFGLCLNLSNNKFTSYSNCEGEIDIVSYWIIPKIYIFRKYINNKNAHVSLPITSSSHHKKSLDYFNMFDQVYGQPKFMCVLHWSYALHYLSGFVLCTMFIGFWFGCRRWKVSSSRPYTN